VLELLVVVEVVEGDLDDEEDELLHLLDLLVEVLHLHRWPLHVLTTRNRGSGVALGEARGSLRLALQALQPGVHVVLPQVFCSHDGGPVLVQLEGEQANLRPQLALVKQLTLVYPRAPLSFWPLGDDVDVEAGKDTLVRTFLPRVLGSSPRPHFGHATAQPQNLLPGKVEGLLLVF